MASDSSTQLLYISMFCIYIEYIINKQCYLIAQKSLSRWCYLFTSYWKTKSLLYQDQQTNTSQNIQCTTNIYIYTYILLYCISISSTSIYQTVQKKFSCFPSFCDCHWFVNLFKVTKIKKLKRTFYQFTRSSLAYYMVQIILLTFNPSHFLINLYNWGYK